MVRNNALKLAKLLNTAWLLFCLPLATHSLAAGWQHNWQEAAQVNVVPIFPVVAEVVAAAQQQQSLVLPAAVRINQLLVQSGERVTAGQALLIVEGAELVNFSSRLEIAEINAKTAAKRLADNEQRYKLGDITRQTWLEWQQHAYQTKLEWQALTQQQSALKKWQVQPGQERLVLNSPTSGVVSVTAGLVTGSQISERQPLLTVTDESAYQFELQLPLNVTPDLLRFADCQLNIIWQSQAVSFQKRTWRSDFIPDNCPVAVGQKVMVTPAILDIAYKIPRQSLVQSADSDAVIADPKQPVFIPVRVLSREDEWLYVQGELAGRLIATSDIAALKGMLMGLGAAE